MATKVKFTAAYDAEMLNEIKGDHGQPKICHIASAILYNIISAYSDPDVNDGWMRFSVNRWNRMTGLGATQLHDAVHRLIALDLIEWGSGALSDEEFEKYGKGNLYRIHRPSFGAATEADHE